MMAAISQNANARLGVAAVVGAILGMLIGWCTNAAMVEISINAIFALYFGFFFLFLAGVITWRVVNFSQAANRHALLVLSGLMGLAGLICVFYQRHWFFSLSAALRVPIYAILGVSLSFALSFAIAELLNYASTHTNFGSPVAPRAQSALVQSPQQIFLLAVASVSLGFVYGIIFGFAEIGKGVFTLHTLRTQFLHEERICLPIGALVGAVTGFLNEKWRPGASSNSSGSGSSSSGSAGSGSSRDRDGRPAGGLSGFGAEPNIRRSVSGNDTGGSGPNAFAGASDVNDGLDEFDPFPTNAKTKY